MLKAEYSTVNFTPVTENIHDSTESLVQIYLMFLRPLQCLIVLAWILGGGEEGGGAN